MRVLALGVGCGRSIQMAEIVVVAVQINKTTNNTVNMLPSWHSNVPVVTNAIRVLQITGCDRNFFTVQQSFGEIIEKLVTPAIRVSMAFHDFPRPRTDSRTFQAWKCDVKSRTFQDLYEPRVIQDFRSLFVCTAVYVLHNGTNANCLYFIPVSLSFSFQTVNFRFVIFRC